MSLSTWAAISSWGPCWPRRCRPSSRRTRSCRSVAGPSHQSSPCRFWPTSSVSARRSTRSSRSPFGAPSPRHPHGHDHPHGHEPDDLTSHAHLGPGQWLLRSALFFGTGAYFLSLWFTGNLGYYINARFAWLSLIAAVVFLLLGASCAYAFAQ